MTFAKIEFAFDRPRTESVALRSVRGMTHLRIIGVDLFLVGGGTHAPSRVTRCLCMNFALWGSEHRAASMHTRARCMNDEWENVTTTAGPKATERQVTYQAPSTRNQRTCIVNPLKHSTVWTAFHYEYFHCVAHLCHKMHNMKLVH